MTSYSESTIQAKVNKTELATLGAKLFNVDCKVFKDWYWQQRNLIYNYEGIHKIIHLNDYEKKSFEQHCPKLNFGVSPYYLTLIKYLDNTFQDSLPLRRQFFPDMKELEDSIGIDDPLEEEAHSPVKEVVHLYPDRVAFCVALICSSYCRYCFRKRRTSEDGLHFNRKILKNGLDYIRSNPSIKDVLLTGGDPFVASDKAIENLLIELKKIPHVELIRFGTKTPVTMPYRSTPALAKIISKYHPVWINTHFNCEEELTTEAKESLKILADHGIPLGNQSVLLKGVNDSSEKILKLCKELVKNRVRPYYLFYPHLIKGTKHLRVDYRLGADIIKKMRGNISGYAIPQYILDTPSGKVPVSHNYILQEDGNDLLMEDLRGEIWREKDAILNSL